VRITSCVTDYWSPRSRRLVSDGVGLHHPQVEEQRRHLGCRPSNELFGDKAARLVREEIFFEGLPPLGAKLGAGSRRSDGPARDLMAAMAVFGGLCGPTRSLVEVMSPGRSPTSTTVRPRWRWRQGSPPRHRARLPARTWTPATWAATRPTSGRDHASPWGSTRAGARRPMLGPARSRSTAVSAENLAFRGLLRDTADSDRVRDNRRARSRNRGTVQGVLGRGGPHQ